MIKQSPTALPRTALQEITVIENNEAIVSIEQSGKIILGPTSGLYQRSFLVRESINDMLIKAANSLPEGICLMVLEGHRSLQDQQKIWNAVRVIIERLHYDWSAEQVEKELRQYVAVPTLEANHITAGAVDVLLCNRKARILDMGVGYITEGFTLGDFQKFPMFAPGLNAQQMTNRTIFRYAMQKAGFVWYPKEYWHYCYGDRMWAAYVGKTECLYGPIILN